MTRHIRVRGIKRRQIDEDKLALAFLLLAKTLHEADTTDTDGKRRSSDANATPADEHPEAA